jgi:hypothetical protein
MSTGHLELRLPAPRRLASIIFLGLCETLLQQGGLPLAATHLILDIDTERVLLQPRYHALLVGVTVY